MLDDNPRYHAYLRNHADFVTATEHPEWIVITITESIADGWREDRDHVLLEAIKGSRAAKQCYVLGQPEYSVEPVDQALFRVTMNQPVKYGDLSSLSAEYVDGVRVAWRKQYEDALRIIADHA